MFTCWPLFGQKTDGQNLDCLFCSCSSSICAVSARQSHNHTCTTFIIHGLSQHVGIFHARPSDFWEQQTLGQNQTLRILSFQIWHHNPWRQTCALNSNFRFHPFYMFPDLSDQWICGQNVKWYKMGIGMNLWPFCFLHLLTSAFSAHQPCTNLFEFQLKRKKAKWQYFSNPYTSSSHLDLQTWGGPAAVSSSAAVRSSRHGMDFLPVHWVHGGAWC